MVLLRHSISHSHKPVYFLRDHQSIFVLILSKGMKPYPTGLLMGLLIWLNISLFFVPVSSLTLLGAVVNSVAEIKGEDLAWKGRFPVLLMAHRGFSGKAPENTLPAFRKAFEIGSDFIEMDVRLSKDGHLIGFHEDAFDTDTEVIRF